MSRAKFIAVFILFFCFSVSIVTGIRAAKWIEQAEMNHDTKGMHAFYAVEFIGFVLGPIGIAIAAVLVAVYLSRKTPL